jgi:serine/threonine-protein kinase
VIPAPKAGITSVTSSALTRTPLTLASFARWSPAALRENGGVPDLAMGTEVGGCRLEQVIGRGGMGIVYRGRDLRLDRPVAVKLVAAEHSADAGVRRRFEREARLMAAIDHPNVIPVYGAGDQDGHLYLVMRYVDGTDLRRLLSEHGRLDPVRAALIVDQVGRALDAAHERGLVHRDIKPANVLLSDNHAYLTDFGITRLIDERTRATDSGEVVGTLDFMSPEQLRGVETDARSDVYSLGCVLYACLTGNSPFRRSTPAATMLAHLEERPAAVSHAAGVSRRFDPVLARALAKRPQDRYQSAGRLGTAALAAAEGRGRRTRGAPVMATADHSRRGRSVSRPAEAATIVLGGSNGAGEAATIIAGSRESPTAVAPTVRTERRHHRLSWRRAAGVAGLLGLALAAAVAVTLLSSHKPRSVGPLSRAQVSRVVHGFAGAYGRRDVAAIGRLLAPAVVRVSISASEHGRAAVLSDYREQLRSNPVPIAYELSHLRVAPGWVARATADYTLRLRGGASVRGSVVFGVQRVGGRPRIGLIATRQL